MQKGEHNFERRGEGWPSVQSSVAHGHDEWISEREA